ncbi:MAG: universal stress protein [Chloroflexi bacterium]|nr:universal stress protein [Chloroflexota bacterium]
MKVIAGIRNEQDAAATKAFLESAANLTEVVALAVVPSQSRLPSVMGTASRILHGSISKLQELEKANAAALLESFKSSVEGLSVQTSVLVGNPADELLKAARQEKADFILLMRRLGERQAAPRLGHVASRVVRYAPCSVILLDPAKASPKTVLYATDGSRQAELAGERLRSLGLKGTPKLLICTVAAPFRPSFIRTGSVGYDEYQRLVSEIHEQEKAVARQLLAKATASFSRSGFNTQSLFYTGDTADTLLQAIQEFDVDFLAVGAKGVSAVERFLLGSVTLKLLGRAPCSVMVAR